MKTTIIELVKQCPDVSITIKAHDLVEAINYCVDKTRIDLEQQITDANTETYLTPAEVSATLKVSLPTLWRWSKAGYLVPMGIGGKRRYLMSDVKRILEGKA